MPNMHKTGYNQILFDEDIWAPELSQHVRTISVRIMSTTALGVRFNIRAVQKSLFALRFWVRNFDLLAWPLTDYLVQMQFWDSPGGNKLLDASEGYGYVMNWLSTKGYFDFFPTADMADDFDFTNAVFDVILQLVSVNLSLVPGVAWTSLNINASAKTITANTGTPFSTFVEDDLIRVSMAEDVGNNQTYRVDSIISAGLGVTLKDAVGYGRGSNNTTDTTAVIQRLVPNPLYRFQLLSGVANFTPVITE